MSVPVEVVPHRGRPRDPRRREAILAAAIALVAEVGYDRMTVDALAARAGVSKPTIYRRWPGGKAEIIVDAIRAERADGAALPDTGSLRGDLIALHPRHDRGLRRRTSRPASSSSSRAVQELDALFRDEVVCDERRDSNPARAGRGTRRDREAK